MLTKKRFLLVFSTLAVILSMAGGRVPTSAVDKYSSLQEGGLEPASLEKLLVSVTGLKDGDVARVTLIQDASTDNIDPILEHSIIGGLDNGIVDMSRPLEDGYYRLEISAPDEYFRVPKSWDFMVSKSELVNPQGKSAEFKLIPPELQMFEPDRQPVVHSIVEANHEPPVEPPTSMVEHMSSLSSPARIPNVVDSVGYHYFKWKSTLASPGMWARFTVSDPGVRHGATAEFVVDHIYIFDWDYYSMEIGWAECSWRQDVREMFVYDGIDEDWHFFNLPGSPLEVQLRAYSGSTLWYAMAYYSGTWHILDSHYLGFSQYEEGHNGGEVFTDYADHPSFPAATTDLAKLYISNDWVNWDWQRWATTEPKTSDTYDVHTSTNYYDFYIHKH